MESSYGQEVYSPYSAMGNAPSMMIDPNGESFYGAPMISERSAGENPYTEMIGDINSAFDRLNGGGIRGAWGNSIITDLTRGAGSGSGGDWDFSGLVASMGGAQIMGNFNLAMNGDCVKYSFSVPLGSAGGGGNAEEPEGGDGDNSSTQKKVLFFSDEKKAYAYMLKNTGENADGNGLPRPVENFAYVTKDGVYILPTSGQDIDGNDYRNYANEAEWRVLNYKIDDNGMLIQKDGKWKKVLATVHTHTGIQSGSVSSHSGADKSFTNFTKTLSIVLSFNGQAYGMIPDGRSSVNFAPNSDLTSGNISIINHSQYLIKYIKQNGK